MAGKRLFRSRREALLGGVCGGIAEYFDLDPSLIRLLLILTLFLGGAGLVVYLVAWVIVPENPQQQASPLFERNQRLKDEVLEELKRAGGELAERIEGSIEGLGEGEGGTERRSAMVAGVALIILGAAFLFRNFIPWLELERFWPVVLIALGGVLVLSAARREKVS
jgi:phage shock protein PspC (stress-responsive transcriptional regulator)